MRNYRKVELELRHLCGVFEECVSEAGEALLKVYYLSDDHECLAVVCELFRTHRCWITYEDGHEQLVARTLRGLRLGDDFPIVATNVRELNSGSIFTLEEVLEHLDPREPDAGLLVLS